MVCKTRYYMKKLSGKLEEVKIVIFTGIGRAFVCSADIKLFPEFTDVEAMNRLQTTRPLCRQMERTLQGQFGQLEINLDIVPGGGVTNTFPGLWRPLSLLPRNQSMTWQRCTIALPLPR